MKKNLVLTSVILGMAGTALLFSGCNKPTERTSVIDSAIAADLMELKELGEITGDAKLVYSSSGKLDISSLGTSVKLKQMKLEGKVDTLVKKIKTESTKNALEVHLNDGAIAIVVLDDQIKIFKVTSQTTSTLDTQVTSLTYIEKLKALSKASEASAQASLVSELEILKYKSPAELNQTFGLSEITSLKIKQHGSLDNDRTDYNEKKSILKVIDRPFNVSTYIVVGEEIGSEAEAASLKAEASAEKK